MRDGASPPPARHESVALEQIGDGAVDAVWTVMRDMTAVVQSPRALGLVAGEPRGESM
jgi:hypothetical protein